ncbi:MAG TPA: hypothetical protein VNG33_21650 [Polyangiaceae bacterium]|nr:hypothetical protein [Polyangiaceae bacterium]
MKRSVNRRNLVATAAVASAVAAFGYSETAAAEVTLVKPTNATEGFEVYTSGRVNAFISWAKGQNMPQAPLLPTGAQSYQFVDAGGTGVSNTDGIAEPILGGADGKTVIGHSQGTVDSMRVRSGFVANTIGLGVRRTLNEYAKVNAFTSIWSNVESTSRRKYFPNYADVREGWLKIEGPWGSFLAGKALTLYNRGATEANFLYLHGYGLGYPGSISVQGPAAGMIGFGILASTFSGGLVYTTPSLAGLQLAAGIYDPANLVGSRFDRTGWARPEAELTFDQSLSTLGKIHVYVNGTYQNLYVKQDTDSFKGTAKGIGAGARVELGPVHLAGGVHAGKGLGLTFALEPSAATYDGDSNLRSSSGFYGMGQVVVSKFDFNVGFGQTRIEPLKSDLAAVPGSTLPGFSLIRTQTGYAGAVVFHASSWLHFDVDVMHADFRWTLKDKQLINFYNAGTTITW